MNKITGLKDLDREILKHVDDKDLLRVCSVDRRMWNQVCDEAFLKRRMNKYNGIEKYKKEDESWKSFFARCSFYIIEMREKYQFNYSDGDFQKQYNILKNSGPFTLLAEASRCHVSLVKYALEKGINVHYNDDEALRLACSTGQLDIVKYLLKSGADFNVANSAPFFVASFYGHLDVVKFLVDSGVDINAEVYRRSIKWANSNQHFEVVNYLEKLKENRNFEIF